MFDTSGVPFEVSHAVIFHRSYRSFQKVFRMELDLFREERLIVVKNLLWATVLLRFQSGLYFLFYTQLYLFYLVVSRRVHRPTEQSRAIPTKISAGFLHWMLFLYLNEQTNITISCNIFRSYVVYFIVLAVLTR